MAQNEKSYGTADQRLGTAPLLPLIFSLALPTALAQLVNLLYNIVDRIYVGHIPGTGSLALAGLGVTYPIIVLITLFPTWWVWAERPGPRWPWAAAITRPPRKSWATASPCWLACRWF